MAFLFYRSITIDHTKCGTADSSNFAVMVAGTYSYLATSGNGGKVQNSSGYDVGFYSDAALTSKLSWETELYTATTGAVIYWVKVPTVSKTTDTVIYMAYDDSTISSDQSAASSTWDSNFKCVWHMNDNAASTTILKSTSTGANATNVANTSGKTVAGENNFGKALTYNGTTDGASAAIDLSAVGVVTLSCWANWTTNANDDDLLFEFSTNYNSTDGFIADWNSSAGTFTFGSHDIGQGHYWTDTFTRPSAGSFHLVHLVIDRVTPVNKAYVDGTSQSLTTDTHGVGFNSNNFGNSTLYFMSRATTTLNGAGVLDEVRLSTTERNSSWITTEYNNQNSPSTFYTVGNETSTGGSAPSINIGAYLVGNIA